MSDQAIELPAARMICDTPGCGYVEEVSPRDIRKLAGAQCPRCSSVMVTDETVKSVEAMLEAVDLLNAAIGPVEGGGARAVASARFDRAGDISEATFKKLGPATA